MRAMRLVMLAVVAGGMSSGACGGCKKAHVREAFFPELHESPARKALTAQAARGARVDATLYAIHFDGPALNSLGQAKLDLMLAAGDDRPLVIHLGVPEAAFDQRRGAVEAYLAQAGLEPSQFRTVAGLNPAATHAADESLSRMRKTENPQSDLQNGQETPMKLGVSSISPGAAAN